MAIRKAGIIPIAGIEDFINAGDTPDYYGMYLDAGNRFSALHNLATSTEGAMSANAINALGGYFQGMGEAALAKAKYGKETPNTANQVLGVGANLAGLAGSFGGGGPGIGTGAEFGEVGTTGSDLADFGYSAADDIAFHDGTGIDYGYL